MSTTNVFGLKVKYLRDQKVWTQLELANRSNLSQSEISKLETGGQAPQKETIKKLAAAFEITPESLARSTPYAHMFGQIQALNTYPKDIMQPFIAYFGSALTGLTDEQMKEIEHLDQRVQEICEEYNSYQIILYRPRLTTSPKDQPDISPSKVYEIDREKVATANILILAALFPSLGAGMELQLALQACSTVIILKKLGQKLSRMVEGCPAKKIIVEYSDEQDLSTNLTKAFNSLLPTLEAFRSLQKRTHLESQEETLGKRIKHQRELRQLKPDELASRIGVDPQYIQDLENKQEEITNPSLVILRKISLVLGTSESYLINGHASPIHKTHQLFSKHHEQLWNYAIESKMTPEDFDELWTQHVEKHGYLTQEINRISYRTDGIGTRKYWEKLHEQISRQPRLF